MASHEVTDPRRVEYLPLTKLTPDSRNPKAHDEIAIDASIGRFGFIEPVVLDERTGHIISGHGRTKVLTAMRDEGQTPPNGVRVDEDGTWHIPVVVGWASRTDLDASGALIALNRTTELGGWVDDELLGLLDDLAADGEQGLDGVGYGTDDIEALSARLLASEEDIDMDFSDLENDDESGGAALSGGGRELEVECPNCEHRFAV